MTCPVCGGTMVGDGYTMVIHCENAELPVDAEPDAEPVFCKKEQNGEVVK